MQCIYSIHKYRKVNHFTIDNITKKNEFKHDFSDCRTEF